MLSSSDEDVDCRNAVMASRARWEATLTTAGAAPARWNEERSYTRSAKACTTRTDEAGTAAEEEGGDEEWFLLWWFGIGVLCEAARWTAGMVTPSLSPLLSSRIPRLRRHHRCASSRSFSSSAVCRGLAPPDDTYMLHARRVVVERGDARHRPAPAAAVRLDGTMVDG